MSSVWEGGHPWVLLVPWCCSLDERLVQFFSAFLQLYCRVPCLVPHLNTPILLSHPYCATCSKFWNIFMSNTSSHISFHGQTFNLPFAVNMNITSDIYVHQYILSRTANVGCRAGVSPAPRSLTQPQHTTADPTHHVFSREPQTYKHLFKIAKNCPNNHKVTFSFRYSTVDTFHSRLVD